MNDHEHLRQAIKSGIVFAIHNEIENDIDRYTVDQIQDVLRAIALDIALHNSFESDTDYAHKNNLTVREVIRGIMQSAHYYVGQKK